MRILRSEEAGLAVRGGSLALGNLDGVHLGHRALLAAAREEAAGLSGPAAVLTFDPHPAKVLNPEMAPRLLTTLPRKLELIAESNLDAALIQTFDRAFAARSARDFVEGILLRDLGVRSVV